MDLDKEIIKRVQQNLRCPVCGNTYEEKNIRLRGFLDETYVLQAYCSNEHFPSMIIFSPREEKEKVKYINSQISAKDVVEAHKALKEFDGNFEKIWKKENKNGKN